MKQDDFVWAKWPRPDMSSLYRTYRLLRRRHGHPSGQWRLWCKRPKTEKERQEVAIGAILTQQANWKNVELAFKNLKEAKADTLRKIHLLTQKNKKKLAGLIRPSGFYKQKTGYLGNLARFIVRQYGGQMSQMAKEPLAKLRRELLAIKGVGPETADSILLYALDKPIFVIDEYTRRLLRRKKISYAILQHLFESNLKKDYRLYQNFHALIVIEGKMR